MIDLPYSFIQAVVFTIITYPAINFHLSAYKIFMYLFSMFSNMLFFNYYGMAVAALTPNYQVAIVCEQFGYTMFNLFAGFIMPAPVSLTNLSLYFASENSS